MATGKILIVDDDTNICELLRLYIEKEGYEASIANDGETALKMFDSVNPDLVLLDIMLPGLDGWQVCREIRKKSSCPIIMLTAKGEVFDKVLGLELGADDYVVKPFETKEVIARIGAVLRRSGRHSEDKEENKVVTYENLSINLTNYELKVKGVGFDYYGDSRTVDVHVKRLREKLEGASDKWALKTVWGVGYKFEVKE